MRIGRLFAAGVLFAVPMAALAADITVGVLEPLTGRLASYGLQFNGSIKLFEDGHTQLSNGDRIKLVVYDTRGDLTEAINLTRRLVSSENVVAIIGPLLSGEAEVAFPIGVQGKTPIISPSSAKPGVAAANRPYGFQFASTSEKMTGQLMDKWLASAGKPIKTVVIIVDAKDAISKSDGTLIYPPLLKQRGIEIRDTISIQTGDLDYSAPVTRAKSLDPDGLVITTLENEGGNLMREVRKQGMRQPVLGNVGILNQQFIKLGGPAVEGVMMASDFHNARTPEVVKWASDYEAKNKIEPQNVGALMYDTLLMVRSCIESQKVTGTEAQLAADRDKMQKCMAGLKDFPAPITGTVSMNDNGEAVRNTQILSVRDGKFAPAR